MAHTKAGASSKNLRDSQPKFLGVKLYAGERAKAGMIIVRQRGTKFVPGEGTQRGKDDTIFAIREGKVKFESQRKTHFDGSKKSVKRVSIIET